MKKILLTFFLLPLSIGAILRAQIIKNEELLPRVSINDYFNYATIDEVLEALKSKYNLKITYNKADIPQDVHFSYKFSYNQAAQAIDIVLRGTPLNYIISHDAAIIIFDKRKQETAKDAEAKTRYTGAASRKNFTLSGIVKDKSNGEPLPFVNVLIAGTTRGATTNVDGYFTIQNVPNDTCGISVSYIGYRNTTAFLSPKTPLSNFLIELESQSSQLGEVVVKADREELMRASEKVSMIKLTPAKLQALPSVGEKDIMRAFQLMPGVSAANENSSGLYVRGGTPDQTLVLYDGFNVYHVEHLLSNPTRSTSAELIAPNFQYYGRYDMILYRINAEYASLYEENGSSSINLTAPFTNVENGLGIFTGIASDTLCLTVKK